MLTERTFETGAVVINYAEGETEGPPLVMLHGATVNWQSFGEFIPTLERHWHIYACDLRGHGKSGRSQADYRVVDYVPDTVAFVEGAIGQPVVLLGFSMGANIALGVAAHRPDLVQAVILLDPSFMLRELSFRDASETYNWVVWLRETQATARTFDEIVARCRALTPEMDDAGARDQATMVASVDPASIACLLDDRIYDGFDLEEVLPRVACPALLVRGERELESVVRDSDAAMFEALVSHGKVIQVKGVGHGIIWGPPGQVVLEHVSQFLTSLPSVAGAARNTHLSPNGPMR